ncbi:Uncharacterised protein [Streptococcus pneumoniae]
MALTAGIVGLPNVGKCRLRLHIRLPISLGFVPDD